MKRIGVDVDGCLTNVYNWYLKNGKEYASKVCKELIEEGYELYIITARFNSDKNDESGVKMRKIIEQWFKDNDIPYTRIIYSSEDKLDICLTNQIDIMIEDKVSTLLDIKKHIPVICFDAPYNRNIDDKNLFSARNWKEIKKILENKQKGE